MRLIFRLILPFVFLFSCENQDAHTKQDKERQFKPQTTIRKEKSAISPFEISTFQTANGWAYQIRQNGKLVIDQPTIPGRPGTAGFQTQADAQKVAELVKAKLNAKEFPPSVSEADLQNLNIH